MKIMWQLTKYAENMGISMQTPKSESTSRGCRSAENSTVNRMVAGSKPARGASCIFGRLQPYPRGDGLCSPDWCHPLTGGFLAFESSSGAMFRRSNL
jgi:hypothetical protein